MDHNIDETIFESLHIKDKLLENYVLENNDSELLFTFIHTTINGNDNNQQSILESFHQPQFKRDLMKARKPGVYTLSGPQREMINIALSEKVNGGGPKRLKRRKSTRRKSTRRKSTRRKSSKRLSRRRR